MQSNPFHIDTLHDSRLGQLATRVARPLLSRLLALPAYRALYARAQELPSDRPFELRALEALEIQPRYAPAELAGLPRQGPLIVAANHPHGALDGLLLAAALRTVRNDVRVLTNHLLARIPELSELCYFVDPFGGRDAAARSRSGLRAAHVWLRRGGALVIFPAGEVAHTPHGAGTYADSEWQPTVGRLAQAARARIVPAFIEGSNSAAFYAAGQLHASLRTALLARELLKQRGRRATVRFGAALPPVSAVSDDPSAITRSIRRAVDELARPRAATSDETTPRVSDEVEHLPADSLLVESGTFQVFVARAAQIPAALREIGRLREVSYRLVGEGTGHDIDLDRFDEHYLHLFSWDREARQIVGAYRIGQTDRITATTGIDGLYTRTLFTYDDRLVAKLSPALELGRSFVRPEYQKNYNALLLLWKGIGQFVVRHPEYRVLFGPVSISARYSDRSQRLLMAFLRQNHLDRDLATLVSAINPSTINPAPDGAVPASVDDANRMIAATDGGSTGVPILLRQYLKLNARLIGFNVDPSFGDALDALMMVDLAAVEPAILNRYLGRQEAVRFLARHATAQAA